MPWSCNSLKIWVDVFDKHQSFYKIFIWWIEPSCKYPQNNHSPQFFYWIIWCLLYNNQYNFFKWKLGSIWFDLAMAWKYNQVGIFYRYWSRWIFQEIYKVNWTTFISLLLIFYNLILQCLTNSNQKKFFKKKSFLYGVTTIRFCNFLRSYFCTTHSTRKLSSLSIWLEVAVMILYWCIHISSNLKYQYYLSNVRLSFGLIFSPHSLSSLPLIRCVLPTNHWFYYICRYEYM